MGGQQTCSFSSISGMLMAAIDAACFSAYTQTIATQSRIAMRRGWKRGIVAVDVVGGHGGKRSRRSSCEVVDEQPKAGT